jgi:cardiolipin synthase A/B
MKLIAGNNITLLKNGDAFFAALEAAIDRAKKDVRLETYIFNADTSGVRIANALMRAASRGVAVRVLVDGFGSRSTPPSFFEELRRSKVNLLFYRPERGFFDFRKSRVRRVHRKIALIDGHTGFVGGINLIDDFTDNLSTTHPRYDYAVQIEGPILAQIYPSVYRLWRVVKWFSLKRRSRDLLQPMVSHDAVGEASLAFVTRDNFRHRRDIEREYLRAIQHAKNEVIIASPYFLPGRLLRKRMIAAARRGVQVSVLLQGVADYPMMQLATRALYDKLLAAGITIYEYQPAMLHGKVAVIDSEWATVGSSNLDPFSLLLNREANIIARHPPFAEQLRASLMEEISQNAVQLNFARWQQRGLWLRAKSWVALAFARAATGLIGVKHD